MEVVNPIVVVAAYDRRQVAHEIIFKHAEPWYATFGATKTVQNDQNNHFAAACVEHIEQNARSSVAVFNAHIQEVCALLRHRPDTSFLTSADKLFNFVVSWADCLALSHDAAQQGAPPETSKAALDGIDLSLERIYFCVIGKRLPIKGSKCPRVDCGNPKMLLVSVSMRSGDEGMATIYLCADCGTLVKKIKT